MIFFEDTISPSKALYSKKFIYLFVAEFTGSVLDIDKAL